MKKALIASAFVVAAASAQADVGAFVGVTYAFGSNHGLGFTLQATSTRKQERGIVGIGVSYYPQAPGTKLGIPVGVGYQWKDGAALVNYDLLLQTPTISGGFVDTRR